jgi:hypothetical protein
MKGDKKAEFVLNCGMAWAQPEFERDKVNRAGEVFFLLQLDLNARTVRTTSFLKAQVGEAQEKYLEVEKTNKDKPEMQTVLVSVDSIDALRKAYPSYYLDITEFVKVLNKILA